MDIAGVAAASHHVNISDPCVVPHLGACLGVVHRRCQRGHVVNQVVGQGGRLELDGVAPLDRSRGYGRRLVGDGRHVVQRAVVGVVVRRDAIRGETEEHGSEGRGAGCVRRDLGCVEVNGQCLSSGGGEAGD